MIVVIEIELGEDGCIGRPVQRVVGGRLQLPGRKGLVKFPIWDFSLEFLAPGQFLSVF